MYQFTPIALYNMLIFSHFIFFGSLHVKSYEEKEIKSLDFNDLRAFNNGLGKTIIQLDH